MFYIVIQWNISNFPFWVLGDPVWQKYFTTVTIKRRENVKTGLDWQHRVVRPRSNQNLCAGHNWHPENLTPRNSKSVHLILLLAEELAAVPAMVPSFRERKPYRAARAAVPSFILHPVVSSRTAWLVTHRPAEHSASTVTHEDPTVIPAGDTAQRPLRDGSAQPRGWRSFCYSAAL